MLWSKPLPDGTEFNLSAQVPGAYLQHSSNLGDFTLSSDAVGATYRHVKAMAPIIELIPEKEIDAFFSLCSTIGAFIIFPSRRVYMKPTINGARGMHHLVRDRFDLTLECIRIHYDGGASPLDDTLERYREFFNLFGRFQNYVEFFLLDDLVETKDGSVKFFTPFEWFERSPLPSSVEEYHQYRANFTTFIEARNSRIAELSIPSNS